MPQSQKRKWMQLLWKESAVLFSSLVVIFCFQYLIRENWSLSQSHDFEYIKNTKSKVYFMHLSDTCSFFWQGHWHFIFNCYALAYVSSGVMIIWPFWLITNATEHSELNSLARWSSKCRPSWIIFFVVVLCRTMV